VIFIVDFIVAGGPGEAFNRPADGIQDETTAAAVVVSALMI
jgi:hypothetical protein